MIVYRGSALGLAQELLFHRLLQQVERQRSLRDDEVVIAMPVEAATVPPDRLSLDPPSKVISGSGS